MDQICKQVADHFGLDKGSFLGITVIVFWANYFPQSQYMFELVEAIAKKRGINFISLDCSDKETERIAVSCEVKHIPTVLYTIDGEEKKRDIGVRNIDYIHGIIESLGGINGK